MGLDKQLHCLVSGRVQGVFFRASTQEQGQRLKLNGWVKNLADGRVEVFASGEEQNIKKLLEWLKLGPPMATVDEIEFIEDEKMSSVNEGFQIR